jgi:hypothetical protein
LARFSRLAAVLLILSHLLFRRMWMHRRVGLSEQDDPIASSLREAGARQAPHMRRRCTKEIAMSKFLKLTLLAVVLFPLGAASALAQGSNQAADDALNWAAVGGRAHYHAEEAAEEAYAQYGHARAQHWRSWR